MPVLLSPLFSHFLMPTLYFLYPSYGLSLPPFVYFQPTFLLITLLTHIMRLLSLPTHFIAADVYLKV